MNQAARVPRLSGSGSAKALAPERAAELLRRLTQAHDDLLATLHALDEITSSDRPDLERYPHARWRLSSARRERRAVAAAIYAELPPAVSGDEAERIARLKADDDRRLGASALHVQQWTSDRIAGDWPGYCAASAPLRAALKERVAAERALLHPLLERLSRG